MKPINLIVFSLIYCLNFSYSQNLELELIASNFNDPVTIKHAGDDRLFIVEREGLIKIINADGTILNTPFLDINNIVTSTGGEQGLLGLAFHPDYENNGYFYVNYINNSENTVVSRFSRDSSNPSLADVASEFILLTINQPYSNHNAGDLAFNSDGYLYIATGDGGAGGDPQGNSQNTSNLLGNILRINVDTAAAPLNYSIPDDNPFVGSTTAREEIWAYGLRNPWKFSFDRLNGDIWIGDVGQSEIEEINKASATDTGLNYGWRCYEGSTVFNNENCSNASTLTFPVTLVYNSTTDTWNSTLKDFSGNWSAFGEDVNGEIYVSDLSSGNIYRLIDTSLSVDDYNLNNISIYPNPTNTELTINFSNNTTASSCKVSIYNIQGNVVKTIGRNLASIEKINVSNLSSGLYILKINANNGEQLIHKLVIN